VIVIAVAVAGGLLLAAAPAPLPPPAPGAGASWSGKPFGAASAGVAVAAAGPLHGPSAPVPASAALSRSAASAPASDDLAAHVPPGVVPTMNQVIEQLHQRGIRTGLGAFNPPGTRPALVGIAVPEGFALPPGYVRHQQTTDDGQPIEAILMFDPDHPPLAAAGRPLRTPAERVVPPELAPAGLAPRQITLPPPLAAAGSAPR